MKVRTCDLILYREQQIASLKMKVAEYEMRYELKAKNYESKLLNKLLGWKYMNSLSGHRGLEGGWCMFGIWEDDLEELQDDLLRCRYAVKTNQDFIELTGRYSEGFFRFCDRNNIPY